MKEKFKTNKGITLIALIITIIVLLILAMVSIKLVWDGGIIEHSKNAVNTYTVEQEKELIKLAYSEYQMNKYNPTEDFKELKEYFVGKDLNNLVDEEKSTDEVTIFTNGIIIKEENYEEYEGKEAYKFSYKDKNYRLIFNSDQRIFEDVLMIPELEIEGVNISGNETNGWTIVFNENNHTYELNAAGNILNVAECWWRFQDSEESQLNFKDGMWCIAQSDNTIATITSFYDNEKQEDILLYIPSQNYFYMFTLGEYARSEMEKKAGFHVELYKWYYGKDASAFTDLKEYPGPSPIQISDFAENEIYCKSYLERIIASFNN